MATMTKIPVAEFATKLLYRDATQGDHQFNAIEFREIYLKDLDDEGWWDDDSKSITLDFSDIEILSPSWANELFGFYAGEPLNRSREQITEKIKIIGVSAVKEEIIRRELNAATGHAE